MSDHGVAFYTAPAGAKLIGRAAAEPGTREISFTFTPTTLNLSHEQECWDPGVEPLGRGAEYTSFVNGHPLGSSTCQGDPDTTPISGTGGFGYSPHSNEGGWKGLGVTIGEPSTFTLRLTKHAKRSVDPQLVAAVYERGRQV